jgi:hypothetical protein
MAAAKDLRRVQDHIPVCDAMIRALVTVSHARRHCPPQATSTIKPVIEVDVRFIKQHPEYADQDFALAAQAALHKAWPCY